MAKRKPKQPVTSAPPSDEAGFVKYLKANRDDTTAHAAFADWLDEHGRPLEAAQHRQAAGLTEFYYKLRRKSDGLFSEGSEKNYTWTAKGRTWPTLNALRTHLAYVRGETHYTPDTPLTDLEVVAFEVRPVALARLPLTFKQEMKVSRYSDVSSVVFGEPIGPGPT